MPLYTQMAETENRESESRHEAKKAHTACRYIYSFNTMKTYIRQLNYMVDWAKENGMKLDFNSCEND